MRSIILNLALIIGFLSPAIGQKGKSELVKRLEQIPEIKNIKSLPAVDHFTEVYEFYFEQDVNPEDPKSEKFDQKVIIGHINFEAPAIFELEGYSIHSARAGELPKMYRGNQIAIEHRFFKDALPEDGKVPWEYLTIENAALDHHKIIKALKENVYTDSKTISTGISKGGQTTMIHRSFYPEDVDVSVCYVAPLNFKREDERIYKFLKSVGTEQQRKQIEEFQIRCLKRKREILPLMKIWAKQNDLAWDFSIEKAFEYYVLEYSFAFWQWGTTDFKSIPDEKSTPAECLSHVLEVSGISFFEKSGVEELRPYFWAALTQEGIYGYEVEPFKEYLSQQTTYMFDFAFPKGITKDFDPEPMAKLNNFVQEKAERMIFINGGMDTWGATGVQLSDAAKKRGLRVYYHPKGHHGTRIKHFDKKTKKEILGILEEWLDVEVVVSP